VVADLSIPGRLKDLPRKLKKHREKMGLTQSQLAHRLGIARSSIACIEKGYRKPSAEVLYKIMSFITASEEAAQKLNQLEGS